MKKMVSILLSLVLFFSLPIIAHATENTTPIDAPSLGDIVVHGEFGLTTHTIPVSDISPYHTVTGPGGTSTIDHMSGGFIRWSVTPLTLQNYTFTGTLEIISYSTGQVVGSTSLFGVADIITGFTTSGIVDLRQFSLKSGTSYKAKLSGTAIDADGTVYTVLPTASIHFVN